MSKARQIADLIATVLKSDPSGIAGASAVTNVVTISQADYTALATKDPNTQYVISG